MNKLYKYILLKILNKQTDNYIYCYNYTKLKTLV